MTNPVIPLHLTPRLHGSPPLRQNRCFIGWLVTLDGPPLEEALDPGLLGTPPSSPTWWPQKQQFSRFCAVEGHQGVGSNIPRGDPIPPKCGKGGTSVVGGSRDELEHSLGPQSAHVHPVSLTKRGAETPVKLIRNGRDRFYTPLMGHSWGLCGLIPMPCTPSHSP